MPEKNILIADDDQVILDILKEMIQREGYRVFLASNGKEAVEAININPIDLAILDIKMPVMDGIEALEEIKKIDQGIEVLIMTGYADLDTLKQAISDYGAFDYILKPFKRADILNGIQNALLKQDFASQKKPREKELEERIIQLEKEFHERTHQLRESQIKYKDIVENSNDAIVVVQDEKLKFANTKTVELTGYSQEELKDMSFLDMVHPEDRDMVEESYKREDFPSIFSFRVLRKSGESLFVEINAVRTTWEKRQATLNIIRDITQRKQAEEALRESEKRYRAILKSIEESYYEVDLAGNLTFFNDSTCSILGYTRDELVGINNRQFMDQENAEKVYQKFNKVYTTGKPVKASDWEIMRNDGTIRFVEASVSLIKDAGGQPAGFRGIGRDITEKVQAGKALRESEEKYRSLVESTEDSIYLVDKNCAYMFMNKEYLKRFGIKKDKIIGRMYDDFHSKEETKEFTKRVKEVFETGKSISYEYRSERDGGYFLRTLSPVKKPDGKITDVTVISKNITDRKQTEEVIKSSEVRFRELFNNMSSGVGIYEARDDGNDFIIKDYNRAGELISKVNKEHIVGRSALEVFPGIKQFGLFEVLQRVWKTGESEHHPVSLYQDDYLTHWAENYVYKLPSGEIVAVFDDVTERVQAEEELKRSQEELRNLAEYLQSVREKERTSIAREIHDELAQALTALKMDISWLSKKLPKDQKTLLEKTRAMTKLTDTTIKTVKRISTELRPGLLDDLGLAAAIEWQAEEFKNRTGITYKLTIDPEEITLDPDRSTAIFRIFQETLTNIARHAKATMVTASLKEKDDKLELRVRDNGKGITKEQISDPQSFGLMGIRERAKSWGGEVKISGRPGKGTTVIVRMPIRK